MCDFKPGDEVVYVGPSRDPDDRYRDLRPHSGLLNVGARYTVRDVVIHPFWTDDVGVVLAEVASPYFAGAFCYRCFRKVERRNDRLSIEAFMTMPGGFEEPRRPKAPAKKRERVQ